MLVTLLALTPPGKRRLPLFILECVSLALICIRMICTQLVLTTTIWGTPIMYFVGDFSWVTAHDEVALGFASALPWVIEFTVFLCLGIQAQTILSAVDSKTRRSVLGVLLVVFLFGFGARSYYYAESIKQAIYPDTPNVPKRIMELDTWASSTSVMLFSGVFAWNVYLTIKSRARMGLQRTDALRILLIVSLESMIIPCKNRDILVDQQLLMSCYHSHLYACRTFPDCHTRS